MHKHATSIKPRHQFSSFLHHHSIPELFRITSQFTKIPQLVCELPMCVLNKSARGNVVGQIKMAASVFVFRLCTYLRQEIRFRCLNAFRTYLYHEFTLSFVASDRVNCVQTILVLLTSARGAVHFAMQNRQVFDAVASDYQYCNLMVQVLI